MTARRLGRAAFLGVVVLFAVLPLYWMLVVSLRSGTEQLAVGNPWWPDGFTLDHYALQLRSPQFGHLLLNTVIVTLATAAISVAASALAAIALAYQRLPNARALALGLFASYLLPSAVLFLPIALMLTTLHLAGSWPALVATYPSLVVPFGTWVLWTFLRHLPADLLDVARAEGASPLQVLRHVLVPLAGPALAAIALFAVAVVFNDYLYAFTLVSDPAGMTLMGDVGSNLVDIADPGATFAEILLGLGPFALLCAFYADTYARGLGSGVIE